MVFYFTGTGNSLYIAREIAAATRDRCISIPQVLHREENVYQDGRIGIVCPVYGHDLPFMVRRFLATGRFESDYLYLILTYGNRHANAVELAKEHAARFGLEFSYVRTILMVDNWLPGFDMAEQRMLDKDVEGQLHQVEHDIIEHRCWSEPVTDIDHAAHAELISRGIDFSPAGVVGFLGMREGVCTGCGICTRVCPAACIGIQDGTAVRDAGQGDGCQLCLACIHACPEHAIEMRILGDVNPSERYLNEHVSLRDIIAANDRTSRSC